MTDLLKTLHDERVVVAKRLSGLDVAIKALNGNSTPKKRTWTMSAEARAKISAAAKKRWAKIKR
jgi:hypothetical protein